MIESISARYDKFREFAENVLIFCIILLAFFVSFNHGISKIIINNMFYIWLFTLNFKNLKYLIFNSRVFLIFLIFISWVYFTCLVTMNLQMSPENLFKYFALPMIIIVTSIKTNHIKYILSSFLVGMFINELISYGIYFEIIKSQFLGLNITGNKNNPIPFITSHMEYTLFLSLAIVLSIFTFFKIKNNFIRIILVLFLITMITNLFLTTGRTGQFTLLMASLFLLVIYFRNKIKYICYGLVLIAITFSLAFNFSLNTNSRIKDGFSDIKKAIDENYYDTSLGIRLTSYLIIPNIIKDEKFNMSYGFGYNEVDKVIQKIQIEKIGKFMNVQLGHLHNTYITTFAGMGIVGLFLLILLFYNIFKVNIEDNYINYIRYSFLLIILFGGFTENMFRQREVMILSAIFISIIIVTSLEQKKSYNE